jgi:hypothetical protein
MAPLRDESAGYSTYDCRHSRRSLHAGAADRRRAERGSIPDSLVARGTAECATQTGDKMTREDRTALCGCMFREMQRTMRMQEMTDIAEAAKASGGDEAARTHLFFSNEKIRNSLARYIQDFGRRLHLA